MCEAKALAQASTVIQKVIGFFTGRQAEFVDPRIVAMAEGRDVTRVSTHGFVELSLTAVFKDTKKFGYDLTPQTVLKFSEFPLEWPTKGTAAENSTNNPAIPSKMKKQSKIEENPRTIGTIQESEEEILQEPRSHKL